MSWEAAKAGDPKATVEVCCVVGIALLAHFGLCYWFVRRYWPQHQNRLELADLLAAAPRNWALAIPALCGVAELRHGHLSRWKQVNDMSTLFLVVYVTWNALHFFILLLDSRHLRTKVPMLSHHVLSVVAASLMLFGQYMHWFACLAGCCEITNVFLNFMYLCKEVPSGEGTLQDKVPQWMYVGNGVLLWLSFAVFRIALFPYLLCTMFWDAHLFPEDTWDTLSGAVQFLAVFVNMFLLMLSMMWFVPITKGLFKHVLKMLHADGTRKKMD